MLLKEINAENFRMFGRIVETTAGFSDVEAVVDEEGIRITSALWRYDQEVLVEPVVGIGILFIRSIDGVIYKFLLAEMVVIFGGVEFCILPYEGHLCCRLYSRSERRIVPITKSLIGNGYVPSICVRTLYAVRWQDIKDHYLLRSEEHPFWEFLYLQRGSMVCETDGKRYDIHQGQMILLAPHRTHIEWSDCKDGIGFLKITFDGEIAHAGMISNRPVYADDDCIRIMQEIIREYQEGGRNSHDMIACDMGRMLIVITRNVYADTVVTHIPEYLRVSTDNPYVSECVELIYQDIAAHITLPDLADRLNLSSSYLSSLFKHNVGRSVSEYVRLVRLEKVKELLVQGKYSIAQISDILGYCSPTYLSTEFKREFQVSPKEYVKSLE